MSVRWVWIFAIATALGTIVGLVSFLTTLEGANPWLVFVVGVATGASAAACALILVGWRLLERTKREAAPNPLDLKRAELMELLPSREERLAEIRRLVAQLKMQMAHDEGGKEADRARASMMGSVGADSHVAMLMANVAAYDVAVAAQKNELDLLAQEQADLTSMSDEEFMEKQKRAKGLA